MRDDFDYPRPQLRRRRWTSLNGEWRFAFDPKAKYRVPADVPEWPLTIEVPFAPESIRSGIGDTGFHRVCWYARDIEVPDVAGVKSRGDRVLLHFGAVDYHARVWINGVPVVEHEGGHTPFAADITYYLRDTGAQQLCVWAEDDPHDLEKPRGKQDWQLEPHSIWYPRTTGIWQTVWFEIVPKTYIDSIRWTPNVERWELAMHVFLEGDDDLDLDLAVRLRCGDQVLADDVYKVMNREVHRRIGLSDPGIDDHRNQLLWSPEQPTLLDVDMRLMQDGTVLDDVASYTALRSIDTQREKLVLNGRYYNLRLVLDQGYWPDTLMTAPSGDALRRDVELAKKMGFNGVRKHQKIEDPRYLYWADVLGLLVWEEMPSQYRFTPRAVNRMIREWSEAIRRDRSHPCIVVWVPFNESWGVPDLTLVAAARNAVAALYHLTKTLDPSRLVVGNDGWESSATDIIGIHDYDAAPAHMRVRYGPEVRPQEVVDQRWSGGRILTLDGFPHRGQPICLSEFGGVTSAGVEETAAGKWGYVQRADPEDFAALCCELIEVARTTGMFSGFCYTQFADTFQEANGLLTADREPKIPFERLAAAVCGKPSPQPPT